MITKAFDTIQDICLVTFTWRPHAGVRQVSGMRGFQWLEPRGAPSGQVGGRVTSPRPSRSRWAAATSTNTCATAATGTMTRRRISYQSNEWGEVNSGADHHRATRQAQGQRRHEASRGRSRPKGGCCGQRKPPPPKKPRPKKRRPKQPRLPAAKKPQRKRPRPPRKHPPKRLLKTKTEPIALPPFLPSRNSRQGCSPTFAGAWS